MSRLLPNTSVKVTVATAGTRVALSATSLPVIDFTIQADITNAGYIYIGDSNVASDRGYALAPGVSFNASSSDHGKISYDGFDLNDWYIDSSANSQSIQIIYHLHGE